MDIKQAAEGAVSKEVAKVETGFKAVIVASKGYLIATAIAFLILGYAIGHFAK